MRTTTATAATSATTALLLLAAAWGTPAGAQGVAGETGPPRVHAEMSAIYASPVGEFAEQVRRGFGLGAAVIVPVAPGSVLGLVLDGGFINYGHERREVCLAAPVGCRVRVDLTTSNNIYFAGVGPQLAVPAGPATPYVRGTAGFSYFGTHSSISGTRDHHSFASTQNYDDVVFALGAAAGVLVDLPVAAVPVQLGFGARYHSNGRAEYLRRGDIEDMPDGSIVLNPQRTEANLVSWHLGLTVGVPSRNRR
jgi:hypothetical protein